MYITDFSAYVPLISVEDFILLIELWGIVNLTALPNTIHFPLVISDNNTSGTPSIWSCLTTDHIIRPCSMLQPSTSRAKLSNQLYVTHDNP